MVRERVESKVIVLESGKSDVAREPSKKKYAKGEKEEQACGKQKRVSERARIKK